MLRDKHILQAPEGESGGGGAPPEQKTIPIDVLPEELRNRSPAEVKFLLERMSIGLSESNSMVAELRKELSEIKSRLESKPPEPDPDDDIPDEELVVKNPEKAVMRILERKGFVSEFGSMQSRLGETVFATVGATIPDFDEYQEDVRKILKESGSPMDEAHIRGAYTMAVGLRVLENKAKASRKAASSDIPKPDGPSSEESYPELQGLEKEIFIASGLDRKTYEALKSDEYIEVKVPT